MDTGLLAKLLGVDAVAQAYGGQICSQTPECFLSFAQLRDVLAAEDSAVVTQKDDDRWLSFPEHAKANFLTVRIGKNDGRECFAQRHDVQYSGGGDRGIAPRYADFAAAA